MSSLCKRSLHMKSRASGIVGLATAALATLEGSVCIAAGNTGAFANDGAGGGPPEQIPTAVIFVVFGVLAAVALVYLLLRGRSRDALA
jgi:hypothetical protein